MSHGVILGQTPALPADIADKSYVNNAISNLSNSLTNTINNAISNLENRLKNYVDNAIAGISSGDAPVIGSFWLSSTWSTYDFGPYEKKPKFIFIFPNTRYIQGFNANYLMSGVIYDDGEFWRYESAGIQKTNADFISGSGDIGDAYQSGGKWYVRCEKSSFMGPDFWNTYYRNANYVVFF